MKNVHKCTDNINGSTCNTSPIVRAYKCKYSYTTVVSILCSSLACQPLPSALQLLHNHGGKGLVRLYRFSCSRGMCGMWRNWLQTLVDTWVRWKDSSSTLCMPNDRRKISLQSPASELVDDSHQEQSTRTTIPKILAKMRVVDVQSAEILNWRHTQVTAVHTKPKILPVSIERQSKENVSPVLNQRCLLTANTWKPVESDQTLPSTIA